MLRSNLIRLSSNSRNISSVSSTLLAKSRQVVQSSHDQASDQLGDLMAKRWLGAVRAPNQNSQGGSDSDRVN
jgi:hypothetical protein